MRVGEAIGWYGTAAILGAYAALRFQFLAVGFWYQLLNATGAAAIIYISYRKKAFEPATLNAVWLCIALVALVRLI